MRDILVVLFAIVPHAAIAFFVGHLAEDKGRNYWRWFMFSFFMPTWGLFYVMLVDEAYIDTLFPKPVPRPRKQAPNPSGIKP